MLASVIRSGVISSPIKMLCGTHQGCPLSLPIFNLVLKLLGCAIRLSKEMLGIKMAGLKHKLLLCADNILHIIDSLLKFMNVIAQYGKLLPYSITLFNLFYCSNWNILNIFI